MDQTENTMSGGGAPQKSMTPIIGGLVLIIVLAAIGWYVLKGGDAVEPVVGTPQTEANPAGTVPDQATQALSTQGTSDEVKDIQADLNATDLNSLNDIQKI